jgi:hypothetical protein
MEGRYDARMLARLIGIAGALAACGGNTAREPDAPAQGYDAIQLATAPVFFDDLRFAPDLNKVLAVPFGGQLFLVDPDTNAVTTIAIPSGCATADSKGSTIYAGDRQNFNIVIIDSVAGKVTGTAPILQAFPDYVRASPTTNEVWVTLPGVGRIDYYTIGAGSPATLTRGGAISIADPEGLEFDGAGHAYTNSGGKVVQIDVAAHAVLAMWSDGCPSSHGFPQSDTAYGLVFGGCETGGSAGVVSTATGTQVAMTKTDGGPAILAYDQARHHFYLRGDGGTTFAIYDVSPAGALALLHTIAIPSQGHGATADQNGHAWVCDPEHGGILRVTDTF